MRLLGVDLGDKRTGLASGDSDTGVVFPLTTLHIPMGPSLAEAIIDAARTHEADLLVIGLPLNMDGTEGPRAKLTRTFGDDLSAACTLPVVYQDERLTTFEAEHRTRGERVPQGADAHAAAVLLEEHLQG